MQVKGFRKTLDSFRANVPASQAPLIDESEENEKRKSEHDDDDDDDNTHVIDPGKPWLRVLRTKGQGRGAVSVA